jgi:hypothetical protein
MCDHFRSSQNAVGAYCRSNFPWSCLIIIPIQVLLIYLNLDKNKNDYSYTMPTPETFPSLLPIWKHSSSKRSEIFQRSKLWLW